jgi:DNA-binding transcriptional LysR family regulator
LPDNLVFAFKSDNPLAQISAIRAGLGIGICQMGIAAQDPDLLPVLPELFRIPLDTWVVTHEGIKTARRYRVTFDALVDGLLNYTKGTAHKRRG